MPHTLSHWEHCQGPQSCRGCAGGAQHSGKAEQPTRGSNPRGRYSHKVTHPLWGAGTAKVRTMVSNPLIGSWLCTKRKKCPNHKESPPQLKACPSRKIIPMTVTESEPFVQVHPSTHNCDTSQEGSGCRQNPGGHRPCDCLSPQPEPILQSGQENQRLRNSQAGFPGEARAPGRTGDDF